MVTTAEYERAERELTLKEWRRGWLAHAIVYAVVVTGLVVLNLLLRAYTEATFIWFPFPLVGWGIGLGLHYVYDVRRAEQRLEARQTRIERLAERMRAVA